MYFLLGISPEDTQREAPCTSDEFVDAFHKALFLTNIRILLGRAWKLLPQGQYLRVCKIAHSYLDFNIDLATSGGTTPKGDPRNTARPSLVQSLSSQSDDTAFIRSQILQGMMASQETTSSLLGNAIFLLSRYPIYWQQLRTKVLEKGDGILNFHALLDSRLIQNILYEGKFSTSVRIGEINGQ